MKSMKIKKFLKENNAIIKYEEEYNMRGIIKDEKFNISAYTGNQGNTIIGYLVHIGERKADGLISQKEVIDFIQWYLDNNNEKLDKYTEEFLGEDIFKFTNYDEIEDVMFQYYDVEFPFDSMKKYNGNIAVKYDNGRLDIVTEKNKTLWSGFITDIPEFRKLLFDRYKEEN